MVRAGRLGEREQLALEKSVVTIGWDELTDLSGLSDRSDLSTLMTQHYSDASPRKIANWVGQVWAFCKTMAIGDLVALPLKRAPAIAFGRVLGNYRYEVDLTGAVPHTQCAMDPRSAARTDRPGFTIQLWGDNDNLPHRAQ